jgi:ABC-type branched-subunit amino acid transport system ATPase component/ABC-type branched-subunit amino acid transport system permease subunit
MMPERAIISVGNSAGVLGMRRISGHPLLAVAALFLLLPIVTKPVGLNVATEIAYLSLYATAFNLLLGYTGVASFGHSLFVGMGAYGTGLIQIHLVQSTSLALFLSAILAGVTALLLGALIIRRKGVYFALLTLAFTQMMYTIAFRWSVTGGEMGLQGIERHPITPFDLPIDTAWGFYLFTSLVSFAGIALLWMLIQTPFGHTLQGIRENERRMRLLGCNTTMFKLGAFAISGTFSGLAGGLQGLLFHSTYAQVFDWNSAGIVLVITVLGGTRSFLGPIVGAVVFVFLQNYLSTITQHWMIALGLIFIVSIIFLPDGIASLYTALRRGRAGQVSHGEPPFPRVAVQEASGRKVVCPAALTVSGLSKRFGAVVVAEDLTFSVKPGELFSIIGPNGAGKTTLFNMISGLLPADQGEIRLDAQHLEDRPDYERARMGLSRSFQIVSVFKRLTVFENVRLAVQAHRGHSANMWVNARNLHVVTARTWSILDRLGLADKAHIVAEKLPYGDQRLVEIGISIASDPPILLLDEPLAGLAEAERNKVAALIRQLAPARTVVLVEHDIDRVLSISDHVCVLHQGHLVASADPATVAKDPEVLRVYLGNENRGNYGAGRRSTAGAPGRTLLSVRDLTAAYGKSQVLHGVSLDVRHGEIVGLLGRNGVGKTTTVLSIMGVVPATGGSVTFKGVDITRDTPDLINRAGIGLVPQGRRIFPNLSVLENLRIAQIPGRPGRWKEEKVFEVFPRLSERRTQKGRYLSGGEQQLLAIARALMGPLDLLILDEPLEGLSPIMADLVVEAIERLREENLTVLLVEQTAAVALRLVDRVYVLNNGQITYGGRSEELTGDIGLQHRLLGVHGET